MARSGEGGKTLTPEMLERSDEGLLSSSCRDILPIRMDISMDTKNQVGEVAGEVWNLLSSEGPQTVAQLKKKLKGSSEVLSFALGWLAREDKIDIFAEKKTFRVELK